MVVGLTLFLTVAVVTNFYEQNITSLTKLGKVKKPHNLIMTIRVNIVSAIHP